MSLAKDKGYIRGRVYLRECRIETLTFEEYKNLGKVDVKQQYKRKDKQDEYLLGWWQAGEQFLTLFKQDDAEVYGAQKRLLEIRSLLANTISQLKTFQEWRPDDTKLQEDLEEAAELLDFAQAHLQLASDYLKKPERSN